jgi:hypothetical protein
MPPSSAERKRFGFRDMIFAVNSLLHGVVLCSAVVLKAALVSAQEAPHERHAARLGGSFATAASDTLHVEAVWSEQRRLRVFVVDASGGPAPVERLRDIEGVVRTGDSETALVLLEVDGYFEARIPTLPLPAAMLIVLKTSAGRSEDRLAVAFETYSPDAIGFGRAAPPEIPDSLPGILRGLADDRRAAQALMDKGEVAAVSVPEERIRELALALVPYLDRLPRERRQSGNAALTEAIRASWLLHLATDYGNQPQWLAAFKQLADAVDRITAAFSGGAQ